MMILPRWEMDTGVSAAPADIEALPEEAVHTDEPEEREGYVSNHMFLTPSRADIDTSHRRAAVHALNASVGKLVDLVNFTATLVAETFVTKET